jgi:rhomboid family GlyGly-CTERM serine protease
MRRAAWWPLLCALLIACGGAVWLAGVAGHVTPERWMWHAEHWRAQPWTLWSAPLLHFLWPHLLGNVLALAALAVAGASLHATPRDALALLLAWPLCTLALPLWPPIGGYYGLSGVVHAATAIVALRAMAQPPLRWLGLLLGGGLMIKLALERGWAVPVAFDTAWGFNVVFAAHLSGAAAGAALAVLCSLGADAAGGSAAAGRGE